MGTVDDVATMWVVARMGCRVAKSGVTGTQSGLSEIWLSWSLEVIAARDLTALVKVYRRRTVMAMPPSSGTVRWMWMSRAMAGFIRLAWVLSVMLVFRFDEQARKDHTRPTRLGIILQEGGMQPHRGSRGYKLKTTSVFHSSDFSLQSRRLVPRECLSVTSGVASR